MGLYRKLVSTYNWSLKEIDDTDIETLMDFIFYKENNPNVRIINGKEYRRAKETPNWL